MSVNVRLSDCRESFIMRVGAGCVIALACLLSASGARAASAATAYDISIFLNQPYPFDSGAGARPYPAGGEAPGKLAGPPAMKKNDDAGGPKDRAGAGFVARDANWGFSPEITLDLGYYYYDEPGVMDDTSDPVFISLGVKDWDISAPTKDPWKFLYTAEITKGWVAYDGSGTLGKDYYKFRAEGFVGYRLEAFTPIIGLGYRWLFDHSDGEVSSTGLQGYDRRSEYLYLPIGIIYAFNEKIRIKGQFNYLLLGKQTSYLSDVAGLSDVENDQSSGWGLDFTVDYAYSDKIGVFSYFRYWDIEKSDTVTGTYAGILTFLSYEPANTTNELGVGVSYKF